MSGEDRHYNRLDTARRVKERYEESLMNYPGVVGVGLGLRQLKGSLTDEVAIIVMVRQKRGLDDLEAEEVLPRELDGVPVDVQETGLVSGHMGGVDAG